MARLYFTDTLAQTPFALTIQPLNADSYMLRFDTLHGFFYKLQSTPDLLQSFADDPAGFIQAVDTSMVVTDSVVIASKFYRVLRAATP